MAIAFVASVFACATARAQTVDPAQAANLFKQGREALAARDYARACAAFAESAKLDVKVGTLINLADCEEHQGQLSHAHAHWQQAVDRARVLGDDRAAYASKHFEELDAHIPKLTIVRGAGAPAGTVVRRDGIEIGEASLGQPMPVDVGRHEIEASAPGMKPRRYVVNLDDRGRATVEAIPGERSPETPVPALPFVSPPRPTGPTRAEAPPPPAPSAWTTNKTLAVATGVVGIAALGTGAVFGVIALGKKKDLTADGHCTSAGACDGPDALGRYTSARDGAGSAATISTIGVAAGAALVAAGVVLWITSPSPSSSSAVRVGVSARGVDLVGAW